MNINFQNKLLINERNEVIENFLGGMKRNYLKNILGTKLKPCCNKCIIRDKSKYSTGYYRDGLCSTGESDIGTHIVCAIVDNDFLQFTKSKGNDLITPHFPNFPGLVEGDRWCLCIHRWIEAFKANKAPRIIAESTNEIASAYIDKKILLKFAIDYKK